ncbi:MAG: baseplate J/gp47 family protein [Acetobacteraceae bacterium]
MQLSLQSFATLVQNMAAAVQAAASQAIDLTIGSTLRAILEATASVALWLQWLILQVLQMTRAATSSGADLDSWMADMSLVRLPAIAASGEVTFSRLTPTSSAIIPSGALVRTADGTQTYAVVSNTAASAWSQASNGYLLSAGAASLTVPVIAQQPGASGNVQTGMISQLVTAIPGVDTVSNEAPLQNGMDAESDPALRARFQNYIQSRSRATPLAVGFAITSIQQNLSYTIQENVDGSSAPRAGSFVVTVDDGSGYPPASLLSTAAGAIESIRPVGSTFVVLPPAVTVANVSLTLTVSPGISKPPIVAAVAEALANYINGLAIGAPLPVTRVAQVAYGVSSSVTNVSSILLNSQPADLAVSASGIIKSGIMAVS